MFLHNLSKLKRIFKNFPKRHFLIVLFGFFLLALIWLISEIGFTAQKINEDFNPPVIKNKVIKINIDQNHSFLPVIKEAIIKRNDSLFSILKKLGVNRENIQKIIDSKGSDLLSQIKIGNKLIISLDEEGKVTTLNYVENFKTGIKAELNSNSYKISKYELETEKEKIFKNVKINDSLYSAGIRAKIPESVIMDLVYIFGWDIDFAHDIRPEDSYSLIYEEILVNGIKKINGDILIAEFINQGKKYTAIRYKLSSGISEYFSPDGRNVKKAFLRSPVKFSYISSKFDLTRKHPVLHRIRAHKGVDYAARKGSPVRATGDGTISFSRYNAGCGNEIKIKHSEDYSTRYCHLDRYHSKAKEGKKVKQGQTIGYVGSTGLVTGPHLHYEFHVNGNHTDPLRVKFPNAKPINTVDRKKFLLHSKKQLTELTKFQSLINLY